MFRSGFFPKLFLGMLDPDWTFEIMSFKKYFFLGWVNVEMISPFINAEIIYSFLRRIFACQVN